MLIYFLVMIQNTPSSNKGNGGSANGGKKGDGDKKDKDCGRIDISDFTKRVKNEKYKGDSK
ncbi:hypothetical protein [Helicobacter enhydrae]|uniref:hypothetical protein n=1 Tax=Helicobacter enhydrae TaxID=222136 RepID=UPI001900D7C6|nr:hypothetical protein [Helicobacter enhydrae]